MTPQPMRRADLLRELLRERRLPVVAAPPPRSTNIAARPPNTSQADQKRQAAEARRTERADRIAQRRATKASETEQKRRAAEARKAERAERPAQRQATKPVARPRRKFDTESILAAIARGEDSRQIALERGTSLGSLRNFVRAHNIPLSRLRRGPKRRLDAAKTDQALAMIRSGMRKQDVAKHFNLHPISLRLYIRRLEKEGSNGK